MNKKFYWLKLKENFFSDKRIKRLRKLAGGDTYTIIYQKMLLLSMRDEGKLYFDNVEETFIKEIALTIDEDEDDVAMTIAFLERQGLIECVKLDDEYFLTEIPDLIGSETASTRRSRKSREQKALQCNTNATPMQQKCNGEIEIDKDIYTPPIIPPLGGNVDEFLELSTGDTKSCKKNLKKVYNKRDIVVECIKSNGKNIPPTREEVEEYCKERNNGIDPDNFIDFYESKGWLVGKAKMKDWKASIRTWERNRPKQKKYDIPKVMI